MTDYDLLWDCLIGAPKNDQSLQQAYSAGFKAGKKEGDEIGKAAYNAGKQECFNFFADLWFDDYAENIDELKHVMRSMLIEDTFDDAKKWLKNYEDEKHINCFDIVLGPDKRQIVVTQVKDDIIKGFYVDSGDTATVKTEVVKKTGEKFRCK